jgi:hypothetical protein
MRLVLLALAVCLTWPALGFAAEVRNVKVVTSGSVDWSSPEAVAAATLKGDTDEAKILNFWTWYRRTMWHYHEWPERRDFGVSILSEGCTLCGSHAALQMLVLKAGGYRTRPCFVMKGGHTLIEVFYGEKWHAFDAMTAFYVYSRGEPRYILGLEDMKAEPELVSKAMEEKRAPDVFLACAREPEIKKTDILPWSHFDPLDKTIEYFTTGAKKGSVGKEGDAYGGSYTPGKMNLNLRPGESIERTWDFEKGKYPERWAYPQNAEVGPYHRCGHNDEFDKANFPYWEPYLKEKLLEVKRCYRYFTNGRYDRRLAAAELLAAAEKKDGLKLDAGALVAEGAAAGTLELPVAFPYAICDADVKLAYSRAEGAGELELYVLEKAGPRKVWSAAKTGDAEETATLGRFDDQKLGLHGYKLRLAVGAGCKLKSALVSTVFMHNMFAGPYLVPGNNKVTVTVEDPKALDGRRLTVIYKFADGEGWKDEHTVEKVVDKSPTDFEIEVKGPKHPKMRSVRLELSAAGAK